MKYEFEPLIDCDEAAQLLGLHPKTVQLMARNSKLPAIRVGRFWRFRKSEIDHWLRPNNGINCAGYAYRQNEEVQS
jgi:excisionase family DNA binding protein